MVEFGRVSATDLFHGPIRGNVIRMENDQYSRRHIVDDTVFSPPLTLGIEDRQSGGKPGGDLSIEKVFPLLLGNPTKIKLGANPVDGSRWPFGSMFNNAGTSSLDRDVHASGAKAHGGDQRPISN